MITNKEFFKRWTEALRSGKYIQTEGTLYSESKNEFCVLGVGCMVATENMDPMELYGYNHPEEVVDYMEEDVNIIYNPLFQPMRLNDAERYKALKDPKNP